MPEYRQKQQRCLYVVMSTLQFITKPTKCSSRGTKAFKMRKQIKSCTSMRQFMKNSREYMLQHPGWFNVRNSIY